MLPAKLIGLILIFAFAAKTCDPFFISRSAIEPLFAASAIVDLVLGVLLLVTVKVSHVFLVAGTTFAFYFVLQCVRYFAVTSDCDCFGDIATNSGVMALVDLLASLYLLSSYFLHRSERKVTGSELRHAGLIGIVLVAVLPIAVYLLNPHSVLRQTSLVLSENIENSKWHKIKVRCRNVSKQPIRIVGAGESCSFRSRECEVITVAPGEHCEYEFQVRRDPAKNFLKGVAPVFVEQTGVVFDSKLRYFASVDR